MFTPALVFVVSRKDSKQKTLSKSNSPSTWVEQYQGVGWHCNRQWCSYCHYYLFEFNSHRHKWYSKQGAQKYTFKTDDTDTLTHKATDSTNTSAWGRLSYAYRKKVEGGFLREIAREDVLELTIINPIQYDTNVPVLAVKTTMRENRCLYTYIDSKMFIKMFWH